MTADLPHPKAPGLGRALARALVLRCPRCGGRRIFRRWLIMAETCPTCGLRFERLEGYWLGSVALNFTITEGTFIVALIVLMAATWPDVPWTPVMVALVALNTVVPLVAHPLTRTVWVAGERHFSKTWYAEPEAAERSFRPRSQRP